jgi:hypothetical protein
MTLPVGYGLTESDGRMNGELEGIREVSIMG